MNERNSIIIGQPETLDNDLSLSNSPHRETLTRDYFELIMRQNLTEEWV